MFALLKGKTPVTKMSAKLKSKNYTAQYVATKTRENIIIYKDKEVVGALYIRLKIVRELGIQTDSVEVYGEWEEFSWVIDGDKIPEDAGIEWDTKAKGSANKLKGVDYKQLEDAKTVKNMTAGIGSRVEDILYETVPIEELQELYDLSWTKGKDYRILIEDEEVLEFIEGLDKTTNEVGFDTETTGLNINRTQQDKLVGIVMSYEDNSGVYFPILHEKFDNIAMGQDRLLELLKPYCDRESEQAKDLVTHNGGYDWKVMKMHGWDLNIVHDTLIRQALLNVTLGKEMMALKSIMSEIFNIDVVELSDMYRPVNKTLLTEIKKKVADGSISVNPITRRKLTTADTQKEMLDFRFASWDFVSLYGPADGDFPRMVNKEMDKKWDPVLDFIYRLEIELIPVVGQQEYYGVRAERRGFEKLNKEAQIRLDEIEKEIYEIAGGEFNINSSAQKSGVIFDKLGVPYKQKYNTDKGKRGTGANVMKDIARDKNSDGSPKYPIVALLQEQSKVNQLISSFYGKLPKMIQGGSLFASYNQVGTETGRLSSRQPNLQQTEQTSREYMLTDTDDHYFMICDYSQVEYRIMAGMANEKKVVNFFTTDAEADYHILSYANMVGKAYEDITAAERAVGKVLNFGTTYGLLDKALATNLYGNDSMFAQKKAAQARKDYFDGIPNIRDYFEEIRDEAERKKYAETLFKRRRYIEEFKGDVSRLSDFDRGSGRRKAGNMPVQGTAADIMKMALLRIHQAFKDHGWDETKARIVMNIHDEVVVQVHKTINMWYLVKVMREAMEMDLSKHGMPPLYIGANVGYTWADGKDELEAPVYLMDEKVKMVNEMIADGKELPYIEDPRTEWKEEIDKYALRAIKYEYKKGYTSKETGEIEPIENYIDATKNPRLLKYSRQYGDLAEPLVFELQENGSEHVYDNLNEIGKYKTETCQKIIEGLGKGIKEYKIETKEEVIKNKDVQSNINYFGKYKWNVLNMIIEKGVEETKERVGDLIINKEEEPIIMEVRENEGEDITKDLETIKTYVLNNLIKINKGKKEVTLKIEEQDIEFMELIERMLVSIVNLNNFKKDEEHLKLKIEDEMGIIHRTDGYVLYRKFIPLVGKMLINHVKGVGYEGVQEEIEERGSKLVKL